MDPQEKTHISEFTRIHDDFIDNWHRVMEIGISEPVERFYGKDYFVTFLPRIHEHPGIENRESAMDGMRQSVEAHRGIHKRFENRIIRERSNTNMVVFYEQILNNRELVVGRMFTIEDWKSIDGEWVIVRETVEVV